MLTVKKTGLYTSIQDLGRFGYRKLGVPGSGAMDSYAASVANSLLENEEEDAVLEITMTGPTLVFEKATYIATSGAELSMKCNDESLEKNSVHKIEAGDEISFGQLEHGFRGYLAVKGGFKTKMVLGSRSFYFPVTDLAMVKEHMQIPYEETLDFEPRISSVTTKGFYKENILKVSPGPEYAMLNDTQLEAIFSKNFTIAKENNRMAYQLEEAIEGHKMSMLTSATLPGTIQFTPAGKLIILMRDGQTTGGYPRVLQLSSTAVSLLAQKKYGDHIRLRMH
ncbi:biotin-dependent carboxyltransferase family protein [Zeaxanthinibacter sp. PT1]|uniref:5-oxoprolinase subunit C family protein n=1 Tax=Zeaxanthinibacter TaxID=561554 RepID=UPI00234B3E28|nr:biotin-dependent carboxyltransferase family protein [Zeaxanthinibacter sp. PT1]MDC6351404.1 biotin-dependent carboxyltransferase family protein [Zeaxanthinibacter sp. PT1]